MLDGLAPKQRALVLDPSPHVAGLCPRRAGKSYAGAAAALITGEAKPGSISIVISLNLKQLRRLYWTGGPSGLQTLDRKFGLNLKYNNQMLSWTHENGSIGYLMGADDEEQLEMLRGLEADLYLIDECKSFAPARLETLIDEIITPQRASRKGRIIMIGTPGYILAGPFWKATCPTALDREGRKYHVDAGQKDPHGRPRIWSRHHWTLKDNVAKAHQWDEALITKEAKGWSDEHPMWLREYLGYWTASVDGLVYRFSAEKGGGRVTWQPAYTDENPTGLPNAGAPWRLIGGLDIGFEAPTAFVICAYSSTLGELRHVWDYSRAHMLVDDLADLIHEAQARFGTIEKIFADCGNLGKMVVQSLIREHGFPIERAEKREKFDYIELVNSGFSRGEIQIVEGTTLEHQLCINAWKIDGDGGGEESERARLARLGKLKEDDAIPNDSTDAFLYLYRGSLHHFKGGKVAPPTVEEGTALWEKEQVAKYRAAAKREEAQGKFANNLLKRAPTFVRHALRTNRQWIPNPPIASTSHKRS